MAGPARLPLPAHPPPRLPAPGRAAGGGLSLRGAGDRERDLPGDVVKRGDVLAEVDWDVIREAGYDTITPMVVTNKKKFGEITPATPRPFGLAADAVRGPGLFSGMSFDSSVGTLAAGIVLAAWTGALLFLGARRFVRDDIPVSTSG